MNSETDPEWLGRFAAALGYRVTERFEGAGHFYVVDPTPAATFAGAGLHVEPIASVDVDSAHLLSVLALAIERLILALMMRLRSMATNPDSLLRCDQLVALARIVRTPIDEERSGLSNQAIIDLSSKLMAQAEILRTRAAEMQE